MEILNIEALREYAKKHADIRVPLNTWETEVGRSNWKTPSDIKESYKSASFLAQNVVIFNIKGNKYRLEVVISYNQEVVTVLWLGTHAEYDLRNKKKSKSKNKR